jgi:hypothetical protein
MRTRRGSDLPIDDGAGVATRGGTGDVEADGTGADEARGVVGSAT